MSDAGWLLGVDPGKTTGLAADVSGRIHVAEQADVLGVVLRLAEWVDVFGGLPRAAVVEQFDAVGPRTSIGLYPAFMSGVVVGVLTLWSGDAGPAVPIERVRPQAKRSAMAEASDIAGPGMPHAADALAHLLAWQRRQ